MPQVIETTVYTFEELNDAAKEKARDWYREASSGDTYFAESVLEDAERMGALMGFTFDSRSFTTVGGSQRSEPAVAWSLGYCQGDYACFEGRYAFAPDAAAKIKDETGGTETVLMALAARLAALPHDLTFRVKHHHYYGMQVEDLEVTDAEGETGDVTEDQHREVQAICRAFNDWIYNGLRKENDYQNADEQIDDTIRANEYTFTATGKREG